MTGNFYTAQQRKKVIETVLHKVWGTKEITGTVFVSEAFAVCEKFGKNHITCPIRNHRGNEKTEHLIRTINERLRANKQIVLTKDKSGLSEIL